MNQRNKSEQTTIDQDWTWWRENDKDPNWGSWGPLYTQLSLGVIPIGRRYHPKSRIFSVS
jgi:hypothetical protein